MSPRILASNIPKIMKLCSLFVLCSLLCFANTTQAQDIRSDEILASEDGVHKVRMVGAYISTKTKALKVPKRSCHYKYWLESVVDDPVIVRLKHLYAIPRYLNPQQTEEYTTDWQEMNYVVTSTGIRDDLLAFALPYEALDIAYSPESEPLQEPSKDCPLKEEVIEILEVRLAQEYTDGPSQECKLAGEYFKIWNLRKKIQTAKDFPQCKPQFMEIACEALTEGVQEASLFQSAEEVHLGYAYIVLMLNGMIAPSGIIISEIAKTVYNGSPIKDAQQGCPVGGLPNTSTKSDASLTTSGNTTPADPGCEPDDEECYYDLLGLTAQQKQKLKEASEGNGNFGIGSSTRAEAEKLGKAWVGPNYRTADGGKRLISENGLRQYRPPSYKVRLGKTQANFESKSTATGKWTKNGHLDIMD